MEKDKLVLKNGVEIGLEPGGSTGAIQVISPDRTAMIKTWGSLTEENLKTVQFKDKSGGVIGSGENLMLTSESSAVQDDGTIRTTYYMREKTAAEKRMDEMAEEIANAQLALAELYEGGGKKA